MKVGLGKDPHRALTYLRPYTTFIRDFPPTGPAILESGIDLTLGLRSRGCRFGRVGFVDGYVDHHSFVGHCRVRLHLLGALQGMKDVLFIVAPT